MSASSQKSLGINLVFSALCVKLKYFDIVSLIANIKYKYDRSDTSYKKSDVKVYSKILENFTVK